MFWNVALARPAGKELAIHEIKAEMVASVYQVVARPGDVLGPGETVVILESMKMEIPVQSESGGTVGEVMVCEGDVVQEGDVLAVLS